MAIVLVTVFVVLFITDTVFDPELVTYMYLWNGLSSIGESKLTPVKNPTGILVTSIWGLLSVTNISSAPAIAAYILLLAGLTVKPIGSPASGIVAITFSANITSTNGSPKKVTTSKIQGTKRIWIEVFALFSSSIPHLPPIGSDREYWQSFLMRRRVFNKEKAKEYSLWSMNIS